MQKWIFRIEMEAASGQFQNYLKLSKGGLSLTCEVVADNRNFIKEGVTGGVTFVALRQDVEASVRRKQEWIYIKLEQKAMVLSPNRQKQYITAEGFYYFAKKYSLNLIDLEEYNCTVLSRRLQNWHFLIVQSVARGRHISSNGTPCHQRCGVIGSWLEKSVGINIKHYY